MSRTESCARALARVRCCPAPRRSARTGAGRDGSRLASLRHCQVDLEPRLRYGAGDRARPPVLERLPQLSPATVDPAANSSELDAQSVSDLFVRHALDVAQDDGSAVLGRE